jgi:hypothetical protein
MTFHVLNSDDLSLLQRLIGRLWNAKTAGLQDCWFNCLTVVTAAPTAAIPNAIDSAARTMRGAMWPLPYLIVALKVYLSPP